MRQVIYDQRPKPQGIVVMGESTPSLPEAFQKRLTAFDSSLLVVWHKPPFTKKPGRWKIERCVKHRPDGGAHNHICNRVYILMCQDEDGVPVPLGEWVFERLREMRHNWEALGGDTERGVKNAIALSNAVEQEVAAKREMAAEDVKNYNRKDKRVQVNRLMHLIEQHDLRPNK
jgi:hypothetical protein